LSQGVRIEEIDDEGLEEMVSEQEAHVVHEVILEDAEPEMPHPCLYHAIREPTQDEG
jgi:hypothetical protein